MTDALGVSGLAYRYPGARRNAVDGVTAAFGRGLCHVLVGANGSGKTTLLKTLAGVLKPTDGQVWIGESRASLDGLTPKARARKVALLPQESAVPGDLSLREYVLCGRYPYISFWSQPSAEDLRLTDAAIARCGLDAFAERPLRALSSGQRQLARIAQTVAQGAEVLLLDEPTTYLDLSVQQRIFGILKSLRETAALTVVMILHELHQAERVADAVYAMKDGRLVAHGRPGDVLTAATVREVFGVDEW